REGARRPRCYPRHAVPRPYGRAGAPRRPTFRRPWPRQPGPATQEGNASVAPERGDNEVTGVTTPVHPRPPLDPALLDAPGAPTQWTKLGHWPGARAYADAARELARRVGHAAHLRAGDVVVDYACGYGDFLKLWLEEFRVARVVGIEPDPGVTAAIRARVADW